MNITSDDEIKNVTTTTWGELTRLREALTLKKKTLLKFDPNTEFEEYGIQRKNYESIYENVKNSKFNIESGVSLYNEVINTPSSILYPYFQKLDLNSIQHKLSNLSLDSISFLPKWESMSRVEKGFNEKLTAGIYLGASMLFGIVIGLIVLVFSGINFNAALIASGLGFGLHAIFGQKKSSEIKIKELNDIVVKFPFK